MTTTRKPAAPTAAQRLDAQHRQIVELTANLRVVAAVLIILVLVVFIVGTAWIVKHV